MKSTIIERFYFWHSLWWFAIWGILVSGEEDLLDILINFLNILIK